MSQRSRSVSSVGWGRWPDPPLTSGMKKLRVDGPPTDFTLIAEGKEFPVHKVVLFCYSDVLYKMSTNPAFVECKTGRAELKDVKACHVENLVEHMYDHRYNSKRRSSTRTSSAIAAENCGTIEFEMAMVILADQYNVSDLKAEAENRIRRLISDALSDAGEFAVLIEKIYANEDLSDGVLENAIDAASTRLECLSSDDPDSLLETRPEFGISVLKLLAKQRSEELARKKAQEDRRREIQRRRAAGEAVSEDGWGHTDNGRW